MEELFSPETSAALFRNMEVVWGRDEPIPAHVLRDAWPNASVMVAARPRVTEEMLENAPKLRAVVEVSGAFPDTIDYRACARRGVEVLSCAPGFRETVAEMGLAMALAGARGLVAEHEAFREGAENWLADNPDTDFSLFGEDVGFVGFGRIAQELARLLAPFRPVIRAFDPWLPEVASKRFRVDSCGLDDLLASSRCIFVTAEPTTENRGLISAERLARMRDHTLVVLLGRAHLVDFDALTREVERGRLRVVADVFPTEPLDRGHAIRKLPNVILSPHRAAAVRGGRHLIGDMIESDLSAMFSGCPARRLKPFDPERIESVAGIGDAAGPLALQEEDDRLFRADKDRPDRNRMPST